MTKEEEFCYLNRNVWKGNIKNWQQSTVRIKVKRENQWKKQLKELGGGSKLERRELDLSTTYLKKKK